MNSIQTDDMLRPESPRANARPDDARSLRVDLEALARDLDALRETTLRDVGATDAQYILKIRRVALGLEISGRTLIHLSFEPFLFGLGVVSLGLYKILENMEIGHNVMHGQYDFMQDPRLDSKTYEWDLVGTAKTWKHGHNVTHHTFTNVLGKDDDFGYWYFRLSSDVPWKPWHMLQPLVSPLAGLFFDHAVSYYHARVSEYVSPDGTLDRTVLLKDWAGLAAKTLRHHAKEFVFYPALAGPFAPKVAVGNALACGLRNLWSYAVIHCGHLPEDTRTFPPETLEAESRGGYYLRQILGSSNFEAGPVLGALSGHLSHQIEHHLFPEIPAHRYRTLSRSVREICGRHGIAYNTGTFGAQFKSFYRALVRHALPGGTSRLTESAPAPEALGPSPALRQAVAA